MSETSRRTVLAGVAGASAAAALAACGSAKDAGDGAGSGASKGSTGSSSSGGVADGTAGASSGSGGIPLGSSAAIPVGGGKVFKEQKVVVTQPKAGEFKAFSAICTHQGCTVGGVSNGKINCPCHNSNFSAADGSVVGGPAPAGLSAKKITVEGGELRLG